MANTVQLNVVLRDINGNVVSRPISYVSDNPIIATVSPSGLVTGVSPGTTTIRARSEGVEDTVAITVSTPIASVEVLPATFTAIAGETVLLTATARDASNNVLSNVVFDWSSSDDTKATVSETGTVTVLAGGSVTITASARGQQDTSIGTLEGSLEQVASVYWDTVEDRYNPRAIRSDSALDFIGGESGTDLWETNYIAAGDRFESARAITISEPGAIGTGGLSASGNVAAPAVSYLVEGSGPLPSSCAMLFTCDPEADLSQTDEVVLTQDGAALLAYQMNPPYEAHADIFIAADDAANIGRLVALELILGTDTAVRQIRLGQGDIADRVLAADGTAFYRVRLDVHWDNNGLGQVTTPVVKLRIHRRAGESATRVRLFDFYPKLGRRPLHDDPGPKTLQPLKRARSSYRQLALTPYGAYIGGITRNFFRFSRSIQVQTNGWNGGATTGRTAATLPLNPTPAQRGGVHHERVGSRWTLAAGGDFFQSAAPIQNFNAVALAPGQGVRAMLLLLPNPTLPNDTTLQLMCRNNANGAQDYRGNFKRVLTLANGIARYEAQVNIPMTASAGATWDIGLVGLGTAFDFLVVDTAFEYENFHGSPDDYGCMSQLIPTTNMDGTRRGKRSDYYRLLNQDFLCRAQQGFWASRVMPTYDPGAFVVQPSNNLAVRQLVDSGPTANAFGGIHVSFHGPDPGNGRGCELTLDYVPGSAGPPTGKTWQIRYPLAVGEIPAWTQVDIAVRWSNYGRDICELYLAAGAGSALGAWSAPGLSLGGTTDWTTAGGHMYPWIDRDKRLASNCIGRLYVAGREVDRSGMPIALPSRRAFESAFEQLGPRLAWSA